MDGRWTGTVNLYELSEPIKYDDLDGETHETRYVFVSATYAMFSGPETYIFPAKDETSEKPINYLELIGSYQGGLSHVRALQNAGYELVDDAANVDNH